MKHAELTAPARPRSETNMDDYEQIEINSVKNEPFTTDCAARLGEIAVTRSYGDDTWTITHLQTGYRVPFCFDSVTDAQIAAVLMNEIVDWPGFCKSLSERTKPDTQDEIVRICQESGGFYRSSIKDNAELKKRLKAASPIRTDETDDAST